MPLKVIFALTWYAILSLSDVINEQHSMKKTKYDSQYILWASKLALFKRFHTLPRFQAIVPCTLKHMENVHLSLERKRS